MEEWRVQQTLTGNKEIKPVDHTHTQSRIHTWQTFVVNHTIRPVQLLVRISPLVYSHVILFFRNHKVVEKITMLSKINKCTKTCNHEFLQIFGGVLSPNPTWFSDYSIFWKYWNIHFLHLLMFSNWIYEEIIRAWQ